MNKNKGAVGILWLVIVSLVVAAYSGGAVYMWQRSGKMELEEKVKTLEGQIEEMTSIELVEPGNVSGDDAEMLGDEVVIDGEVKRDENGVCASDVEQCPDGSFVSRIEPDCEFEACSE